MFHYIVGTALLTRAMPSLVDWGIWGAQHAVILTYYVVYGRYEEARREARLRAILQEELAKKSLTMGGTDIILA
jgi:hypothetical protein